MADDPTDLESPVSVEVNASAFLMEGMHGVLELRFTNRTADEQMTALVLIRSRVLREDYRLQIELAGGQVRKRRIDLELPRCGEGVLLGCAGPARFEVELNINAGEDGRHRFRGDFVLNVLTHCDNRQQFNVNIERLVEMHGDKAGSGSVNEVNLQMLENLPQWKSVNDLLEESGPPKFVAVELEYEGRVAERKPIFVASEQPPLTRCRLVDEKTGRRLLIYAGDAITLGRSRKDADIVTWLMPRSEEHDRETRRISKIHCRLIRGEAGLFVEHLSATNRTLLDGGLIAQNARIEPGRTHSLQLSPTFTLQLTPLPPPDLPSGFMEQLCKEAGECFCKAWRWTRQTGVGGVLLAREDELVQAERYLWVASLVADVHSTTTPMGARTFAIGSNPGLFGLCPADGASAGGAYDSYCAWPIALLHSVQGSGEQPQSGLTID